MKAKEKIREKIIDNRNISFVELPQLKIIKREGTNDFLVSSTELSSRGMNYEETKRGMDYLLEKNKEMNKRKVTRNSVNNR